MTTAAVRAYHGRDVDRGLWRTWSAGVVKKDAPPLRPTHFTLADHRRLHLQMPTRLEVRQVACPACGAPPGAPCARGGSGANHRARVLAARAAGRPLPDPPA